MTQDPAAWINRSPGDLDFAFSEARRSDVGAAVSRSKQAFRGWSGLSLDGRRSALEACRERLRERTEELARLISRETGKPLREARMEMGGVIAKFDLAFADADRFLREEPVASGPHPAAIRRRPRGPAAVIAPFNFPIHLGHGASVAYLLAGNTVLFKPSPLAVHVGDAYAREMQSALPDGVFEFVPGGAQAGRELSLHPDVRSVCFTGSVPAGTALAVSLAGDYAKSLALELGGKNSAIVLADAPLEEAASAVADGMCLTAGQRCNATSRVLVQEGVAADFLSLLQTSLDRYVPGNPLDEATLLGPLISEAAKQRFGDLLDTMTGEWLRHGQRIDRLPAGQRGHYVTPAILRTDTSFDTSPLATRESFVPILAFETFTTEEMAVERHEAWNFGLTASIFTADDSAFRRIGDRLSVGNLYANLPTTFSPSTLPFGGWGASGNGRPGGSGFIRFAAEEQAVQWRKP